MKRRAWTGTGLLLAALLSAISIVAHWGGHFGFSGATANWSQGEIACYFSPRGGCTEAVVREIEQARQEILVQAYSFTSTPIAQALVHAQQRGLKIVVVLDKSQRTENYSEADFVLHAGIPTYIDDKHAIAHNKIMIIDGQTIITGSFNFTNQAEHSNAENLLVVRNCPDLCSAYQANFRSHLDHSEKFEGRGEGDQRAAALPAPRSHPKTSHRQRQSTF